MVGAWRFIFTIGSMIAGLALLDYYWFDILHYLGW